MSISELKECPVSDLDPWSDEFFADPYPYFHALRALGPIVKLERPGIFVVTRFTEARAVLMDPARFCSSAGAAMPNYFKQPPWRTPPILLEADPPQHTQARAAFNRVMSPVAIRDMRAHFEAVAESMVEALVQRGTFDAQTELADVYPARVFPDVVGVRSDGRVNLVLYGRMVFATMGPQNEAFQTAMAHAPKVIPWIEANCKREELSPDGLGARFYEAADRGELTYTDAELMVRVFLAAGVDTTVNNLGEALHRLSQFPAQWQQLVEDPTLARAAFEETLRFSHAAPFVYRTTTEEVDFFGTRVEKHEKVLVLLNAANRDPNHWTDPDTFDIRRKTAGHVGFGAGIHACAGQMVARMEAECVISALARRARTLEPAGEATRRKQNGLRGFSSIPLKVTPK